MDRTKRISLAIVVAAMVGGAVLGAGRAVAQDAGSGGLITVCGSTGFGDDIGPIQITQEQYDAYVAAAGFPPLTPDAAGHCPFSIHAPTPASAPDASSGARPVALPDTGVGTASRGEAEG